ncbi:hypothetical protein AAFC00_003346 [Neodothiora populina]|uniref:Hydrophobin n=1 Tax=Neodothiora populina TaxID=2781224 RepID=A0ABR3PAH1_9PEZI
MQIQAVLLAMASIAAAASSGPARVERRTATLDRRADLCGPLDTPMCCQTDVEGIADLNCASINSDITSTDQFVATCSAEGKSAECCTLSLLGSAGLLCSSA